MGIHNGVIDNDEELFAAHGLEHAEPGMTVDSEVIFALVQRSGADHAMLEELRGTMATAWLDERLPRGLSLARGVARPLWIGRARREVFFASTKSALEVVEGTLRLTLRKREVAEGRLLFIEDGKIVTETRFRPDTSCRHRKTTQPIATPHEGRRLPREARHPRRVRARSRPARGRYGITMSRRGAP